MLHDSFPNDKSAELQLSEKGAVRVERVQCALECEVRIVIG